MRRISLALAGLLVAALPAIAETNDTCVNEARQIALKRLPDKIVQGLKLEPACDTAACLAAHREKVLIWSGNLKTWAEKLPESCMKDAYLWLSQYWADRATMIPSMVGNGDIPTPPESVFPQ